MTMNEGKNSAADPTTDRPAEHVDPTAPPDVTPDAEEILEGDDLDVVTESVDELVSDAVGSALGARAAVAVRSALGALPPPALRPDAPTALDAIMDAAGPAGVPLAVIPEAFAAVGPFLFGHESGGHEPATRPRIVWTEPQDHERRGTRCGLTGEAFTPAGGPRSVPRLVFDLSGRDGANEYRLHPALAKAGLPAVGAALRHKVYIILDDLAGELSSLHWFASLALQIEAAGPCSDALPDPDGDAE